MPAGRSLDVFRRRQAACCAAVPVRVPVCALRCARYFGLCLLQKPRNPVPGNRKRPGDQPHALCAGCVCHVLFALWALSVSAGQRCRQRAHTFNSHRGIAVCSAGRRVSAQHEDGCGRGIAFVRGRRCAGSAADEHARFDNKPTDRCQTSLFCRRFLAGWACVSLRCGGTRYPNDSLYAFASRRSSQKTAGTLRPARRALHLPGWEKRTFEHKGWADESGSVIRHNCMELPRMGALHADRMPGRESADQRYAGWQRVPVQPSPPLGKKRDCSRHGNASLFCVKKAYEPRGFGAC